MEGKKIDDVLDARFIDSDGHYFQMREMKYNGRIVWPTKELVALAWSVDSVSGDKGSNSHHMDVIGTFDDGSTEAVTPLCSFSSSDPSVATGGAIVYFVEYGSATITATCTWRDVTMSATMTANTNDYAVSISLNKTSKTIGINDSFFLYATVTMKSGGASNAVTWTKSNNTVALSSASGANIVVRGLSGGNPATVTAHCSAGLNGSEITANCVVTVSGERVLHHIAIYPFVGTEPVSQIHIYQSDESRVRRYAFRVMAVYSDNTTADISEYAHIYLSSGLLSDVTLVTGPSPYMYTYSSRVISASTRPVQYVNATYGDFQTRAVILMN